MTDRLRVLVALVNFVAAGSSAVAAAEPGRVGVRMTVPLPRPQRCDTALSTVAEVGADYYGRSSEEFLETLARVLGSCRVLEAGDKYVVVLFTATRTRYVEKPEVIHVVLRSSSRRTEEVGGFPGIDTATWVYLTDDQNERPLVQLVWTARQSPLFGQIGPLAKTILSVYPQPIKVSRSLEAKVSAGDKTIFVSSAHSVRLPFKRASISETDYIERAMGKKPEEIDSETAFANVPYSWVTFHAGVGFLTGKLHGASPAKIDGGRYASDSPKRAATMVGAAFHWRFDPMAAVPSFWERFAVVGAATLTPAGGLYLGPTFGWRGFSVTAGRVWMWFRSPPAGFSLGDEVKKRGNEEQLVYGRVRAWMVGATYVFGG